LFFAEGFDLDPDIDQCFQIAAHIGMVADFSRLDLLQDHRVNSLAQFGTIGGFKHCFQITVTIRRLRVCPAFERIPVIAKGVEVLLCAGRGRVKSSVVIQLHTRDQEMQLDIAHVLMPHPEDIALVLCHAHEGRFLEPLHHHRLLIRRWCDLPRDFSSRWN